METFKQAFLEGLITCLKAPTGKRRRLIISHLDNEQGFMNRGLLMFESKRNTEDYHHVMNVAHIEETDRHDCMAENQNYGMAEYKNINFEEKTIKARLLKIVKREKSNYQSLAVDKLGAEHGVTFLRLPPYHSEFNPTELVWAQVKGYSASNNKFFKLNDIIKLFEKEFKWVTPGAGRPNRSRLATPLYIYRFVSARRGARGSPSPRAAERLSEFAPRQFRLDI
ncbi:hypothetical protein EVAR_30669_1 [Eumeta japonica]|uniref:Tc1-like transposase DDE domain-containing protein n=1 Tax=Eumeta variegata TaxID=151549 RepID=A0A4C1VRD8_EUMVA|nr:hypothetical protein EVAR_30669_1 [Eumeta japonica]